MKNTPTIQPPIINPFVAPRAVVSTAKDTLTVQQKHAATTNVDIVVFTLGIIIAVILPAAGGVMICRTYQSKEMKQSRRIRRFTIGAVLVYWGLNAPSAANWLIASLHDAPLCGML